VHGEEALDGEPSDCRDDACGGGERPERERLVVEDRAADGRADGARERPRKAVDCEVATAEVRRADVGDERDVRGAVEALADPSISAATS